MDVAWLSWIPAVYLHFKIGLLLTSVSYTKRWTVHKVVLDNNACRVQNRHWMLHGRYICVHLLIPVLDCDLANTNFLVHCPGFNAESRRFVHGPWYSMLVSILIGPICTKPDRLGQTRYPRCLTLLKSSTNANDGRNIPWLFPVNSWTKWRQMNAVLL